MEIPSMSDWLKGLGLEQYASVFADNEVDLRILSKLTDKDLKELGIPFGPRKLVLNALAESNRGLEPERRQLTVMFCDIEGYTALASRLDPEILQVIIRRYQDACAASITHYDGYVFERQGDGIVAFFRYPLAHEGEADRAIRAGREIIESLSEIAMPGVGHLRVRIAITTGLVLVDSDGKGAVSEGEALHLAARLQSIAQPREIVVSERVRRLAGGNFQYDDLGKHTLKGIPVDIQAWRVRGPGGAASRFDAATQDGLTPMVGREQELGTAPETLAMRAIRQRRTDPGLW